MNLKRASLVATTVLVGAIATLLFRHALFANRPATIAAQVVAGSLLLWARLTFGIRSFHGGANPTEGGLVTTGPYRWLRHPIYASFLLFPIALACEVLLLGARPWPSWPLWLGFWVGTQALRFAAIRSLGDRWHVRIWVVPGMPLVRDGPYRWLRHPNYLAVVVELIAAPLMFGAWRTALGISALNLVALAIRIRAEEQALDGAAAG